MTILVVGASGATGSQLVEQLLIEKYRVKIIVRSAEKLPESWKTNDDLQIISASILELSDKEMKEIIFCFMVLVLIILPGQDREGML